MTNFGPKMLPGIDIIVHEKIIDCINPLYFRKQLICKMISIIPNQPTLKGLCRQHIRYNIQKLKKNYILNNIKLPKCLEQNWMYNENNFEKNK